jgi:hypothetical protein
VANQTIEIYCQCNKCGETFSIDAKFKRGVLCLGNHPHVVVGQCRVKRHHCGGNLSIIRG